MSEKTHAEIIAEMKRRRHDVWISEFRSYIDELEAAHKREIDELWKRIGDMAKLREAVGYCLGAINRIEWLGDGVFPNGKFVSPETLARAKQKAEAALAAPPRNCDVGTAEEQAKRLDAFCDSHGHGFDGQKIYCCENCQLISVDRCELAWAQMPYGEKEGGAK